MLDRAQVDRILAAVREIERHHIVAAMPDGRAFLDVVAQIVYLAMGLERDVVQVRE